VAPKNPNPKQEQNNVVALSDTRARRVDLQRGTVQEAWNLYVASMALERLKPSSRRVYEHAAKLAIATLTPCPRPGDVRLWLESLCASRAPATVNKILRALKAITERASYVQRDGTLQLRNAFKQQRPLRTEARARRDPNTSTVQRLLKLCVTPFERLAVRLAAFYGLRKGELLGLQPGDAKDHAGKMRVTVTRTRDRAVGTRKNALNGKPHILAVDDGETAGILSALLDDDTRLRLAEVGQRELSRIYIIPWGPNHTVALMKRWRKDEGVQLPKGDGWHALRHYGATQLAKSGASIIEIQAWLGDSTQTAAQTYIGQVRGTTEGCSRKIVARFDEEKSNN